MRKPVFEDSGNIRHELGCATTEDDQRHENSEKGSRGLLYLCSENNCVVYRASDLRLCFHICNKEVFCIYAAHFIVILEAYLLIRVEQ